MTSRRRSVWSARPAAEPTTGPSAATACARLAGGRADGWPERLAQDRYAIFLVPLAPERAADARAHPKPLAVPAFIQFDLNLPPESALALALAVSVWLTKEAVTDFDAVALALPILERYLGGRLESRATVDYGLDWQLAAVL